MTEDEKQRLDRKAIRNTVARGDRTRSQNLRALEERNQVPAPLGNTITITRQMAADVLGALFWTDTINPQGFENIKQQFAALMRGEPTEPPSTRLEPCKQSPCRYPVCACVGGGVCLPPLPPAAAWEMPPLDDDLRDILGRPNFTCIGICQRLREMGYSIKRRAEDEQATTIHLMLQHYFQHGAAWRDTLQAFLSRGAPDTNQDALAAAAISSVHGPEDGSAPAEAPHPAGGVPR